MKTAQVAQQTNKPAPKMTKDALAKQIAKLRDRDTEMVSGIFKNLETPGGGVRFMFKKYPGDDYSSWEFFDGERYRIPRGIAHHLNNNCFYKEYKHLQGQQGEAGTRTAYNDGRLNSQTMQIARKVHRFNFSSLEFMDEDPDMYPADIAEVTMLP